MRRDPFRSTFALGLAGAGLLVLPGCGLLGGLGGGLGGLLGGSGPPYTGTYTGTPPGPLAPIGGGGGGATAPPPGFTPPALTGFGGGGGSPGAPTSVNTPGGSGPRSPTSLLPTPQAGSATAQKIFAAYRIPIYGAGATPPILDVVADGMRHYKPENLRGLDRIVIHSRSGGSVAGQWSTDGRVTEVELMAQQRWSEPVTLHTVTHEFGHHWTLFSDEAGGKVFDQALGRGPQAYVSNYAHNSWEDKLAEAVAFMLIGYDKAEQPPLRGWAPSQQAFAVLKQRIVDGRPTF